MTAIGSAENWRSSGACRSVDPDLFFPLSSTGPAAKQIARAKLICAGCRVRRECLEFALSHAQTYGIWGGTTADERQRDHRRRRRAAATAAKRAVVV
jgi:WhiB family transcriptional regulator, redox-sensing transcriptional regulator